MLDGLADALKTRAEVLTVLERPVSFWVEPLQTMSNVIVSRFPGEKVLKNEKSQKFWVTNVNDVAEGLDKEDSDIETGRYSSTKFLLLDYMDSDTG